MHLLLRALQCPPPDLPQNIQARFDRGGGRIGRSRHCEMPLPDPNRHISREHAEIRFQDGTFTLKVVSRVNAVLVNDRAVEPGEAVQLGDGDRIQIGEYQLEAQLIQVEAGAMVDDPFAIFAAPPATAGLRGADTFSGPSTADGLRRDPFPDDLLSTGPISPPAASLPSGMGTEPASIRVPDWSPEDIDRILGLGASSVADSVTFGPQASDLYHVPAVSLPFPGGNVPAAPLPCVAPAPASMPLDDVFSLLERELGTSSASPFPAQPLAAGPQAPEPAAPAPAAPDPETFTSPEWTLPPPPAGPAIPTAKEAAPRANSAAVNPVHILAEALGLQPADLDDSRPEETLRVAGELLRISLDGLFRMLEMRSQLKNELRIEDRTTIASRENNPLKHSGELRDAMSYLVDVRQHGNKLFMAPGKAVEDAVWDICAHEMALMAGTRAALLASLKLFAPDAVESRIKKSGALDTVLPALYRSKLWEKFLEMYSALEREAEDHFDQLLNQEFARAYSEQSRQLRRKR